MALEVTVSGAFAQSRIAPVTFVMSARQSVCPHLSARFPLDGFPLSFFIENFYEGLSREFKFNLNRAILAATLPADGSSCYCLRRYHIAIRALPSSEMV